MVDYLFGNSSAVNIYLYILSIRKSLVVIFRIWRHQILWIYTYVYPRFQLLWNYTHAFWVLEKHFKNLKVSNVVNIYLCILRLLPGIQVFLIYTYVLWLFENYLLVLWRSQNFKHWDFIPMYLELTIFSGNLSIVNFYLCTLSLRKSLVDICRIWRHQILWIYTYVLSRNSSIVN